MFDGVFWFFHRLCGIFFVTLQDIRAKAEPSLTEKVKKTKQGYRLFQTQELKNLKLKTQIETIVFLHSGFGDFCLG